MRTKETNALPVATTHGKERPVWKHPTCSDTCDEFIVSLLPWYQQRRCICVFEQRLWSFSLSWTRPNYGSSTLLAPSMREPYADEASYMIHQWNESALVEQNTWQCDAKLLLLNLCLGLLRCAARLRLGTCILVGSANEMVKTWRGTASPDFLKAFIQWICPLACAMMYMSADKKPRGQRARTAERIVIRLNTSLYLAVKLIIWVRLWLSRIPFGGSSPLLMDIGEINRCHKLKAPTVFTLFLPSTKQQPLKLLFLYLTSRCFDWRWLVHIFIDSDSLTLIFLSMLYSPTWRFKMFGLGFRVTNSI